MRQSAWEVFYQTCASLAILIGALAMACGFKGLGWDYWVVSALSFVVGIFIWVGGSKV